MNVPIQYLVRRNPALPPLDGNPDHPAWRRAEILEITNFHPRSSSHRPRTRARLVHDDRRLALLFDVEDRYVRSQVTEHNGPVCKDSCVEFFVQPRLDAGYFNFEINCGGCLHLSYVEDPTRLPEGGFAKFTPIPAASTSIVKIFHSMPPAVLTEICDPQHWVVQAEIPLALLESYVGPLGQLSGQTWRANLYKCGDATSHPHWATWAPIGEECNFHQPWHFRPLHFGRD